MSKYSFVLLIFLFNAPVQGMDSNGNYAIWGIGQKPCHRYNLARAAENDAEYKQYTMGFLTAYNHQAENTYSISSSMTLNEIFSWLDDECELKPIVSFEEALTGFIIEHHESRMKSPPGGFGR